MTPNASLFLNKSNRHHPVVRGLLRWIDSNDLPWTPPLPPWCSRRARRLRRLRRLGRHGLRAELIAYQGWPRTLAQSAVWPLMAFVKAVLSLRSYPAGAGAGYGAWFQAIILRWWLQVAHNLRISEQEDGFLHLPANRCRPTAFMPCREHQVLLGFAKMRVHGFPDIDRKNSFARFCAEHRLPAATAYMTGSGAAILSAQPFPAEDLFLKLANSLKGNGAEILRRDSSADGWRGADGSLLAEADIAPYAARRLGEQAWIVQERLKNAPSWRDYTTGALATVRVVTARMQPAGPPQCLAAYIRMPRKHADVDNISAGGIGTRVDVASGQLEGARGWVDVWRQYDHHPDTGGRIAGSVLPGWEEIKALALSAHAAAGSWLALGWDISLAERGPVLVETNSNWAMLPFEPIANTQYIEIMESLYFPDKR